MRAYKKKLSIGRLEVENMVQRFFELIKIFMDINSASESLIPILRDARDFSSDVTQHIKLNVLMLQFLAFKKAVIYPVKACIDCIDIGRYTCDCYICDKFYKTDKLFTRELTACYIVSSYKELECVNDSLCCTIIWILRAHNFIKSSLACADYGQTDFPTFEQINRNSAYKANLKKVDEKMNELNQLLIQRTVQFG